MNKAVFGKTMENGRKDGDIKSVATERRRNYLVLESNYCTIKFFTGNVCAIEMKKKTTEIPMNKHVCLGLSILELSNILMRELWYDYVKPKYEILKLDLILQVKNQIDHCLKEKIKK